MLKKKKKIPQSKEMKQLKESKTLDMENIGLKLQVKRANVIKALA